MTDEDWIEPARELAARFAERAVQHDRDGTFPFENFEDLHKAGFLALTIPKSHGGDEISLSTFLRLQEALAAGDGSTALALNMHLVRFGGEREAHNYPLRWFDEMCRGAVEQGRLCNTVATEEGLGSPAGGGMPDTVAAKVEGGWLLNGQKSFVTLAPVMWYHILLARAEVPGEKPEIRNFMVLRDDPGVEVKETWDAMGMRATGSHDLVLKDVFLPDDRRFNPRNTVQAADPRGAAGATWFALGVSSTSIGVATAARDYAVEYARTRTPNSNKTIKEYPGVRTRVARIDVLLQRSRALVHDAARAWEAVEDSGMSAADRVAVAKIDSMNNCIEAVDLAMRVVGGVSLLRSRPMERFYRDVRVPLHNPPLEDRALEQLARSALDQTAEPQQATE
jgi:alkylation response protein AidB-like acyl-CoA dehydrogenase